MRRAMMNGNRIQGKWVNGTGKKLISLDPATGRKLWEGNAAGKHQIDAAVNSARRAFLSWSAHSLAERTEVLKSFKTGLEAEKERLAEIISTEVGKPRWEALTEVQAMAGKVNVSLEAYEKRCETFGGGAAITRFRPHGVVAVLGPFNFPGHLPNGHIVPALLAGNTVVFKPSELSPLTGIEMVKLWIKAGLPRGVLNMVQGSGEVGALLAGHAGINGVFFTGSARTGCALNRLLASQPGKILALEMGGNNPLIVDEIEDLEAAALLTIQSAYLTAGQRCTCARRLIVRRGKRGNAFLDRLIHWIGKIRVGAPTACPEPFMGAVISAQAAEHIEKTQRKWIRQGASVLVKSERLEQGTGLLTPGLIDVTRIRGRKDEEVFGPLLQVIRVGGFSQALTEANDTRYGLAAGLLSDSKTLHERFYREIRAGIVNWNQPLTGASSAAPFGGTGLSGNHRPSAYFAADYCSYPVASIEKERASMPSLPVGMEEDGNFHPLS